MKDKVKDFVGKKATITVKGLEVLVKILDYRLDYGKDRYEVTPVAGSGKVWTEKVKVIKD